jgi:alpha-galactosidase
VALFNRGLQAANVTARWADLCLSGRQPVRDLQQHRDVGAFADAYTVSVPAHGTVLVKVGRPAGGR